MSKKFLCSILVLLSCSLSLKAAPTFVGEEIPSEFYVKQRFLSWTTTFDIETKQYKLGTVHRKFLSLLLEYDFYDVNDLLQAKATQRFFSWGVTFDVTDANDEPIGKIEQRLFTFFPTFTITSPTGEILAEAKLNFWGTKYSIKTPLFGDQEVASLSRPFFRWKDDWTAKLVKPEGLKHIDSRLFVIVMASQTDRDFWMRQRIQNERYVQKGPHLHASNRECHVYKKRVVKAVKRLKPYHKMYKGVEPTDADIRCIEELMERDDLDDAALFAMLESDTLTREQRSALYLVLKKTIAQKVKSMA